MDSVYIYHWTFTENFVVEIRGYGLTTDGTRVCVHVVGFLPHIYVSDVSHVDLSPCVHYSIVQRENLYNFVAGVKPFYKLWFRTKSGIYRFIRENKLEGLAHEQNASPILQFTTQRKLPQVGWVRFSTGAKLDDPGKCDVAFEVDWNCIHPAEGPFLQPMMCAFDLEVYSTTQGAMPCDKPGDEIFQISVVFSDETKFLLSLPGSDYSSSDEVVQVASERELIEAFCKLLEFKRPLLLLGYNILGFDLNYLIQRCKRLFILDYFLESLGYGPGTADIKTLHWSSDAFGVQEFTFIDWEGLVTLDLYPLIKRDYKFSNYKLETVAQELLGHGKDPISIKDIGRAYVTKEMARVGRYCLKDANLCLELATKLNLWVALVQMANICHLQPAMLYLHGQQMKIHSQIYYYCHWNNIVVNTNLYKTPAALRYTGAYVMEPIPGLYHNVVPFDFSSLYPSIIIAENICYSTIANKNVPDRNCNIFSWEDHLGCPHDPKNIKFDCLTQKILKLDKEIQRLTAERDKSKGEMKKKIQKEINLKREEQRPLRHARADLKIQKKNIICAKRSFRFLKSSVKKGILPTLIQELLSARKQIRAAIKTETDPLQKIIMEKQQLAYKVSANSMYGAMGVRSGYLPYMPGAMVITYCGREAIKKSLQIIETQFSGKVIYGDTDSNYVQFKSVPLNRLWEYSLQVAKKVSACFPESMNLEFEEVIYNQFILLGKKKYVFMSETGKLGHKGIILSRRDNPKIIREIYLSCLKEIFSTKCLEQIIFSLIDRISRLGFESDKENFILTKSVGVSDGDYNDETGYLGSYKVKKPENAVGEEWIQARLPPHVQLAKRLQRRGIPVQPGTRLEIVVLDKLNASKLGEKFEDFDYYCERKWYLKLDLAYYLQSMINPVDQLLEAVFQQKILESLVDVYLKKQNCLQKIKDRRKPKLIFRP